MPENGPNKLLLTRNISVVAGIFCITVSLLLLLNYWQYTSHKPLESKSLEALVQQLSREPGNDGLKQEIRQLDLLARKAYFTSRWQVETGTYLLLFGAIVFAISLRIFYSLKSKIEEPSQNAGEWQSGRILSQKWILAFGATFLVLALISSYLTIDSLKNYSPSANSQTSSDDSSNNGIEVVEVASKTHKDTASAIQASEVFPADSSINEKNSAPVQPSPEKVEKATAFPNEAQIQGNYNGFRGPLGNGVSNFKNTPVDWDGTSGKNLLWKSAIPKPGYNSPVIWEDKLFLSGGDEQMREVYCFGRNTGKLIWSKPVNNIQGSPAKPPKVSNDTGLSAPSVSTDGQRVFAIFATGDIICFDMDGNRLWARNLGVPENHYGHASSLINWHGKVFVQYDTNKGGRLLALNALTGETLWDTKRPSKISWSSPILVSVNGKKQLILTADPIVAGYDTETGAELWSVECLSGEVGSSAATGENMVFAANEYAKLAGIDLTTHNIVWENDEYLPEVASPVVSGGLLFVATSYGVLVCYEAKTGAKLWENDFGTGFYSSPVVCGNKLYALDTKGIMHIMEVAREFKLLGEPALGDEGFATPAFSDGRIYIRGKNNLYCFGE